LKAGDGQPGSLCKSPPGIRNEDAQPAKIIITFAALRLQGTNSIDRQTLTFFHPRRSVIVDPSKGVFQG